MYFSYQFPRPALTVDCVIFGLDNEGPMVLPNQERHRFPSAAAGLFRVASFISMRPWTKPLDASFEKRLAFSGSS